MNVQRLLHLIRVLEAVPVKKFDLDHWKAKQSCGTTACAVGWAASDPEFNKQGLHLVGQGSSAVPVFNHWYQWSAVQDFFGINCEDAWHLFHPDHYMIDGEQNATPTDVIMRIGGLLAEHANFYWIVDDVIGPGSKEGFEVMFGNPWTAVGVAKFQSNTRRECESYINKFITKDDRTYRVYLARRHGEHRVVRIK